MRTTTDRPHPDRSRPGTGRFALFCLVVAGLSLWMRSGFPPYVIAGATEDDALFVRLAHALGSGHWLGPFDDLTLVKGMFYPLFIAAAFFVGLPLKIAEQAVYLGGCCLTALLVRRAVGRASRFPALLFLVLALDPIVWTLELSRVIREGLYVGQSLLLVAAVTTLAFRAFAAPGHGRLRTVALGLAVGLLAGSFWLTREEGLWIVPALAVSVGVAGAGAIRARLAAGIGPRANLLGLLRRGIVPWAAAGAAFAAALVIVAGLNDLKYGAFETTEVQSLAFRRAYAALASIDQGAWHRFVVFPKSARERAYGVSPAARELAPTLDGPVGEAWRQTGCSEMEQTDCPEIFAGWFQWALRDAVAAAGHYGSAAEAATYYRRLADEIEAACARGALSCRPRGPTLAQPFRWSYVGDAIREVPEMVDILVGVGADGIDPSPSLGTREQLTRFSDIVGPIASPLGIPDTVAGWTAAPDRAPALRLSPASAASPPLPVASLPAPDVAAAHPGLATARFSVATAGPGADGDLVVSLPAGGEARLALRSLTSGSDVQMGDVRLHVDAGFEPRCGTITGIRACSIQGLAKAVAGVYGALVGPAALLALLGLALSVLWRRHHRPAAMLVALACASGTAVASRVGLLAYLQVTAIPSANNLYMSPAMPLLLVFVCLGNFLGFDAARHRWAARLRRDGASSPS